MLTVNMYTLGETLIGKQESVFGVFKHVKLYLSMYQALKRYREFVFSLWLESRAWADLRAESKDTHTLSSVLRISHISLLSGIIYLLLTIQGMSQVKSSWKGIVENIWELFSLCYSLDSVIQLKLVINYNITDKPIVGLSKGKPGVIDCNGKQSYPGVFEVVLLGP